MDIKANQMNYNNQNYNNQNYNNQNYNNQNYSQGYYWKMDMKGRKAKMNILSGFLFIENRKSI